MADDGPLLDLARAVAEGGSPDWDDAERSSSGDGRDVVAQLRVLARLADVQRRRDFGHYADLLPIGAGGFGGVYSARDTRLERQVALKFLPDPAGGFASLAEGRLLAQVRHANVVSVYGVESFEGRSAIVMELLQGHTLHVLVREHGPRPEAEAAALASATCRALQAVHAAGLVHGDVSARNVMREQSGRVVLMDFGLRQPAGRAAPRPRGTRPFMAPELLRGEPPSVASDIYAVGVLLFYLRTGRFPAAAPLTQAGALRPLVGRCLAPEARERFASASDLLRALEQSRRAGRRRQALFGVAALAALVVGLATWRAAPPLARPNASPRASGRSALSDTGATASPTESQPSGSLAPRGDPFVPPLGPGPGVAPSDATAEVGVLTIEARLAGAGPLAELELRVSQPVSVYVVRERETSTSLLFPLPGQPAQNPLDPGLVYRLAVGDPHGVLLLAGPARLAAFENRVAALRVPRGGLPSEVALPADALALLREGLGLPARGRLLGWAAQLTGPLHLVRGVWVRRLAPA